MYKKKYNKEILIEYVHKKYNKEILIEYVQKNIIKKH
jgi:hypothetical protein